MRSCREFWRYFFHGGCYQPSMRKDDGMPGAHEPWQRPGIMD